MPCLLGMFEINYYCLSKVGLIECDHVISGMKESGSGFIEVTVPDSYNNFRRVLLYIYTGFIDAPDEQSLVDALVAADRYTLTHMKMVR